MLCLFQVTVNYTISWLTHAGVLLFVGTFIGGLIQGAKVKDLEPNVRVIVHDKSSLAPEGKPIAFCLDPETGFSWIGEYDITADELLSGAGGNNATKTEQAERLILDLLADGKELASEDIVKAAAEAGISERTVQNAKRNMGGILGARRVG